MRLSSSKLVLIGLGFIGIPTTGYELYGAYLKEASATVVSGAEAVKLYKDCMLLRTMPSSQQVVWFLAEAEGKLADAVRAASRLAVLGAGANSTSLDGELTKCVASLERELAEATAKSN